MKKFLYPTSPSLLLSLPLYFFLFQIKKLHETWAYERTCHMDAFTRVSRNNWTVLSVSIELVTISIVPDELEANMRINMPAALDLLD